MKTIKKSLVVRAALAGLFAAAVAAPVLADHHEAKPEGGAPADKKAKKAGAAAKTVNCLGVNGCKGTSECAVEGAHGCAGQNACKGKGWVKLTMRECKAKKGKFPNAKKGAKEAVPATGDAAARAEKGARSDAEQKAKKAGEAAEGHAH